MPNLDIQLIDTYSLNSIAFADISDYGNLVIKNPSFEVSAPGFNKQNIVFTPKQINVYTAADLKLDCDPDAALPDGIYTIKYSIYPNDNPDYQVEKYFFNTKQISNKYQQVTLSLLNGNCQCKSDYNKELIGIKLLIEGSMAAANSDEVDLAYQMYNKAANKIDKFKKCNC